MKSETFDKQELATVLLELQEHTNILKDAILGLANSTGLNEYPSDNKNSMGFKQKVK